MNIKREVIELSRKTTYFNALEKTYSKLQQNRLYNLFSRSKEHIDLKNEYFAFLALFDGLNKQKRSLSLKRLPSYKINGMTEELLKLELHSLEIVDCPIDRSMLQNLAKIKSIKNISIRFCSLSSIPKEVFSLPLESLEIVSTDIFQIPKEIGKLKKLKTLSLSSCSLGSLPKEFSRLHSLEYLSLRNNHFFDIPKEIFSLGRLDFLDLQQCNLKEISKEIGKLKNLKNLWLSRNEIKEIPKEIGFLKKLEKIGLKGNKIGSIPLEMGVLKNLTYLDLSNNRLKELPRKELKTCSKLRKLYLSENYFPVHKLNYLEDLDKLS